MKENNFGDTLETTDEIDAKISEFKRNRVIVIVFS